MAEIDLTNNWMVKIARIFQNYSRYRISQFLKLVLLLFKYLLLLFWQECTAEHELHFTLMRAIHPFSNL